MSPHPEPAHRLGWPAASRAAARRATSLRRLLSTCCLVGITVLLIDRPLRAQTRVAGYVKVARGTAHVVRGTQQIPATLGLAVMPSDRLRCGGDGSLGVTLQDETRISLGPNSEIDLAQFAYAPGENKLQLTIRLLRGVLSYVSGRIAKLAPNAVKIETPTSIIGVRGTHLAVAVGQP